LVSSSKNPWPVIGTKQKTIGYFFVSAGQSAHFRSIIQKLIAKLNLQNSTVSSAKQMRASVITHWLRLYNLRQVQNMAGHKYVSTTETYLVNQVEDLQADIEQFHPIG